MKRKQWLPGWECSLADLADRGGGYIGVGIGQVVQRYPLLTAHHTSIKTFIRGHSKSYRDVAYAQKAPRTNQTKNRLQFPLPRHQHFSGFPLLQAHRHVFGALHSHRSVHAPTRVRVGPPQMARAPWLPGGPRRRRAESGGSASPRRAVPSTARTRADSATARPGEPAGCPLPRRVFPVSPRRGSCPGIIPARAGGNAFSVPAVREGGRPGPAGRSAAALRPQSGRAASPWRQGRGLAPARQAEAEVRPTGPPPGFP